MNEANLSTEASPSYIKKQLPDIAAAKSLWTPLYSVEGGTALGFRCNKVKGVALPGGTDKVFEVICGRVTRTERGMKSHLWSVHRIKQQGELFGA